MAWDEIVVNSKILGHISSGIYRTAGGAIKELISNAFDADASYVEITTNHPSFDVITCFDNGKGMTQNDFQNMMKGGIGDSSKRTETDITEIYSRPVIGRLGIGMLGIAQVCHMFKVISHHTDTKSAFEASIKLVDYLKEKVEKVDPNNFQLIDVGQYSIEEIEYDASKAGTYIIASDMRTAFVKKFRENPGPPLPSSINIFNEMINKDRSLKELGDYWQMTWELSITCPMPYQDEPFIFSQVDCPEKFVTDFENRQNELKRYNFVVKIDGLNVLKPISFPSPRVKKDGLPMSGQIFPIQSDLNVFGKPLKISGYIYLQNGQAIVPAELRGILLRIKNVAIGGYDRTFLEYPKIEGPRFSWLSGEIFIDEGLEQALNIDRASFNEVHPHYVKLQQIIHKEYLSKIFLEASRSVDLRSRSKREKEKNILLEKLKEVTSDELGAKYDIEEVADLGKPIVIDTVNHKILISKQHDVWPKANEKRETAYLMAIAYEATILAPENEREQRFYSFMSHLLGKNH